MSREQRWPVARFAPFDFEVSRFLREQKVKAVALFVDATVLFTIADGDQLIPKSLDQRVDSQLVTVLEQPVERPVFFGSFFEIQEELLGRRAKFSLTDIVEFAVVLVVERSQSFVSFDAHFKEPHLRACS